MRYNKKYNMMEPVYKASSSRDLPKEPGRNAPKTSAPLDPGCSEEESLAHKCALVCYLSTETNRSAIPQV
jgi:hypothetical protein